MTIARVLHARQEEHVLETDDEVGFWLQSKHYRIVIHHQPNGRLEIHVQDSHYGDILRFFQGDFD